MKKIIFAILFALLILPVGAQTLNGGIEYTVESVRKIAFEGIQYKIDKAKLITPNLFDPNARENKYALRNNITLGDRDLELLKAKGLTAYGVTYKSDPFYTFCYFSPTHSLLFVDTNDEERKTIYPNKSYRYNTNGDLINVIVNISYGDNYLYDKSKNLISHCKDDYCYNNAGSIVSTRKVLETYD